MTSDWKSTLQNIKLPSARDEQAREDEFLSFEDTITVKREALERSLRQTLAEVEELFRENRWQDALAIIYPIDQTAPELVEAGLDIELRAKAAFALGQINRFDEAIEQLSICVVREPQNFLHHSSLAYTAYNSLYAASNKEILLRGKLRLQRIALAHEHFKKAQELRPDGVTNFYRQGMLYARIERKSDKAIPLFEKAVANWESLDEEGKKARVRERKNYVKALYQLASVLLDKGLAKRALELLNRCIANDEDTHYMSQIYKYFALGKIYYHLNKFKEARQALEFALTCESERPVDFVYELLARSLLAMGEPRAARQVIERVSKKKRKPYYRWTEADILCALQRFPEARKALLESAERDNRSRHKALIRLAKLEYLLGNFKESKDYARAAGKFVNQTWGGFLDDAAFWEAVNCYRMQEHEKARELARELKERNPRYPRLHLLLARLDHSTR
ncbi:MAG: tetratricopeptide repeat protein [Deltaproteobacteria bacterium]|nr:tetratricopeptide repeat protein [Deltaproteobacteria bacterium]